MKRDLRCPRCEGRRLLHVREVASQWGEHGGNYDLWKLARNAPSRANGKNASGSVEAWVCKQCGYTELYTDPSELIVDGVKVVEIDGDAGQGPYRSGPVPSLSVCLRVEGPNGLSVIQALMQHAGLGIGDARDALAHLPWTVALATASDAIALQNVLTHAGATADLV